ncbi:MAG: hypothetical protein IT260_01060, partial [Saprospiraceae bacterium]|nr:hypothetical protein [Saprospiraceae bacterium]
MRVLLWVLLLSWSAGLQAQVFMRPFDNAAALALGGATVAYPGTAIGLNNDALLGFGEKAGVFLSSALPYSIGDWQTARFQGFARLSARDGLGLDFTHSGIEAYGEQRARLLYGRQLGSKFFLGGSADMLRVTAREYGSATAFTFGLSVLANPLPKVWLGARLQNPLQLKLSEEVVPAVLHIGLAWAASSSLIVLAETEKDLDRPVQVKAGLEYRPVQVLVFRAGFRTEPARVG